MSGDEGDGPSRRSLRRARGRRGPGATRRLRRILGVAAAVVLLAAGGGLWLVTRLDPLGGPGAEVEVVIPPGASAGEIGAILEDAGVIVSSSAFGLYVRVKGIDDLEAGTYRLRRDSAVEDVVRDLRDGPKAAYTRLVLPEGLTLDEIAERVDGLPGLAGDRFLELARSGVVRSRYLPEGSRTLEGMLFPDTYHVAAGEDEEGLLRRMVERFDQVAEEVGLDDAEAAVGLSPYEAVVVASMVETEAKLAKERPLVAAVVFNRLEIGMRLQIDATVLYALGRHKTGITSKDLTVDSPYNTYRVMGLPPTPIASPGEASLRAALHPAEVDYLYYVLIDPSGVHGFTASAGEFERLKADSKRRGVF